MNIKVLWVRAAGPLKVGLLSAAVLAATPGFLTAPAVAQETVSAADAAALRAEIAKLKRDIQRAELDIRRTDSLSREEQATASRNRERLTRDRERRERENAALESRVRNARGRIASEKARGDGYVNAMGELQAREKAVLALLANVADTLAARVVAGIPWDNETRRERVVSLRRDIDAGTATPEEAFARLAALLREEIKSGDEVTLSSRPLTRSNGEVINAQVLKIGNQTMLYADEEGKKFGMLEPSASGDSVRWVWREEMSLAERSAVKRAIAVKGGRDTPQLAALNIPLTGLVMRNGKPAMDSTAAVPDSEDSPDQSTGDTTKGGR
jgi:hypothetical protein